MYRKFATLIMTILCAGLLIGGPVEVQAATGMTAKAAAADTLQVSKAEKKTTKKNNKKDNKKKDSKKNKKSSKTVQFNKLKKMPNIETYTDPDEVPIWYAVSSSWLESDKDYDRYNPANLYDHDLSTAYVEGVDGDGIGEMVEFTFGNGWEATTYAITKIEICPGYQKSSSTFNNNSRPTRLGFYFPDGSSQIVDLGKKYGANDVITVDIDPVVANKCTMVIEDAVTGKKYKDCCISEVTFYSQEITGITFYERDENADNEADIPTADYIVDAYAGEMPIWSYKTSNPVTELTSSAYLTSGFGKVIVYDEETVTALDMLNGEVLWEVKETGFPAACSFDEDGNLYICSYYGSRVTKVDENGEVIMQDELAGDDYSWACMLALRENNLMSIYYAMYEDSENGRIFTTER